MTFQMRPFQRRGLPPPPLPLLRLVFFSRLVITVTLSLARALTFYLGPVSLPLLLLLPLVPRARCYQQEEQA